MTRMTGPDCAVMCNLIIIIYIHTYYYIDKRLSVCGCVKVDLKRHSTQGVIVGMEYDPNHSGFLARIFISLDPKNIHSKDLRNHPRIVTVTN